MHATPRLSLSRLLSLSRSVSLARCTHRRIEGVLAPEQKLGTALTVQGFGAAVERIWHIYDSQDQMLALAFSYKYLKYSKFFTLPSEAV